MVRGPLEDDVPGFPSVENGKQDGDCRWLCAQPILGIDALRAVSAVSAVSAVATVSASGRVRGNGVQHEALDWSINVR